MGDANAKTNVDSPCCDAVPNHYEKLIKAIPSSPFR